MADPKLLFAFINGVYKGHYEKDSEMTLTFLKEQIFPGDDAPSIEGDINRICTCRSDKIIDLSALRDRVLRALSKAASQDWEVSNLETYLKEEDSVGVYRIENGG